ncbi:MAG TPA: hemerythrin domain-containing protein [Gammaproteobacteria bacterium]|nr:hemerythrin domain-containing protein [Gammaproteobacteria bacterium]
MSSRNLKSGNAFIDENHKGLLENIDVISVSVRDNWDRQEFESNVRWFIVDLENHFSHEEVILKAAGFAELDEHSVKHRELSLRLRMDSIYTQNFDDSVRFLGTLRSKIFSHELFEDQSYWPLFDKETEDAKLLISWSAELETGDPEMDRHHRALVNHINRLHMQLCASTDKRFACAELRLLHEYSKFHFSEEEHSLGEKLRPGHRANHELLLIDLDRVIEEVDAGKYALPTIGDYLKYWLINHIQTFDIPSFSRND